MKFTSSLILFLLFCTTFPFSAQAQCVLGNDFLGQDTTVCDAHVLGPLRGLTNIIWNGAPSLTADSLLVTRTGQHTVTGIDTQGNPCMDTIEIGVSRSPVIDLGPDLMICAPLHQTFIVPGFPSLNRWYQYDSSTQDFILIGLTNNRLFISTASSASYLLEVENPAGCVGTDTFNIIYDQVMDLRLNLTPDYGQNNGSAQAQISGGTPPYTYTWNMDSTVNQDSLGGLSSMGGRYHIQVTDSAGCMIEDTFAILNATPVDPYNGQLGLQLFPNPVQDLLQIKHPTKKIDKIEVFNLQGQKLSLAYSMGQTESSIFFPPQLTGIFWIKISAGKQVAFHKVCVQQ